MKNIFKKTLTGTPALLLAAVILSCCSGDGASGTEITGRPQRIVSLSPSITSEMIDLGCAGLIVGVTTWHPPLPGRVEIVGSLINPSIEKIVLLRPDTILCSKEDSAVQKTEQLKSMNIRIVEFGRNSDFGSICENYLRLARLLGREKEAEAGLEIYRLRLDAVKNSAKKMTGTGRPPAVAFFASYRPLITASSLSYIGRIIEDAGGNNIYGGLERPYPYVSAESLPALNPEIIISIVDGGREFFGELFKDRGEPPAFIDNIHGLDPAIIAMYTPVNYVSSVEKIFSIIDGYKRAR